MDTIVELIDTVLSDPENQEVIAAVRNRVNAMMENIRSSRIDRQPMTSGSTILQLMAATPIVLPLVAIACSTDSPLRLFPAKANTTY